MGISTKNNPEQTELMRLIMDNQHPIVFCTGPAGTGKTLIAVATALQLQQDKKYKKILYGRNPVQLGEDMGFLPGDIDDKYSPFMGPLSDNLEAIETISDGKYNARELKRRIECIPISFLRGRSFENAIIIIDEAQNLDLMALRTILTRIGKYSKVILLGSMNQIDSRHQMKSAKCDYEKVVDALRDLPITAEVSLTQSMRSPWCTQIDEIFDDIK